MWYVCFADCTTKAFRNLCILKRGVSGTEATMFTHPNTFLLMYCTCTVTMTINAHSSICCNSHRTGFSEVLWTDELTVAQERCSELEVLVAAYLDWFSEIICRNTCLCQNPSPLCGWVQSVKLFNPTELFYPYNSSSGTAIVLWLHSYLWYVVYFRERNCIITLNSWFWVWTSFGHDPSHYKDGSHLECFIFVSHSLKNTQKSQYNTN